MPNVKYELPYAGAKKMLLVEALEDKTFLAELINAIYDDLPAPKTRKKR